MSRPRTPHGTAAPRRRLRVVLAASIASAALIAGVSTVAIALTPNDAEIVATINGAEITRAELDFHTQRVRATVDNRADATAVGETARDAALRDAAFDEIRADHALLGLAREHGLTDLETFADLRRAREETNDRRADQVANGEVVYGLTEFSLGEFHSRTMSELRTALIDTLSTGAGAPLAVTDAEVEGYLAEHAGEWAAGATTIHATILVVPGSAALDAAAVAALAHAPGGVDAAVAAVPEASVTTVTIDPDGRVAAASGDAAPTTLSPDAVAQLRTLAPGGVTDPQTHQGGWAVVRLDEASVDRDAALATYASRIRAVLAEARFDDLLAERIARQATEREPAH